MNSLIQTGSGMISAYAVQGRTKSDFLSIFWAPGRRVSMVVCLVAWVAGAANEGSGQTQYTADGEINGIEEEARWYANRARYDPVKEKARLSLASAVPSGPIAPLAPNAKLLTAARNHSEDMAVCNQFQHDTPMGSTHYNAGVSFSQRLTIESYSWGTAGENIAAGTGYSTGHNPHDAWFLSETGHRDNLLNSNFREVGIGHHYLSSSTYDHYYTEDLGAPLGSSEHWFTGTIFCDTGNAAYDFGEGIAGVEIYLSTPAGLHSWYDRSSASGSFAIPISAIPDGTNVEVIIRNQTGSATNITIPLNFDTLLRIPLTNGDAFHYGTFSQPTSVRNVGFRDVIQYGNTISGVWIWTNGLQIAAGTLAGGKYELQWRESLTVGGWSAAFTNTATGHTTTFLDQGGNGRPHPNAATSRFYRVVLLRNL